MTYNIYFDGGTALNIVCIYDENKNIYFTKKFESGYTNNELEYLALIEAVKYAFKTYSEIYDVVYYGDSELIIKQMKQEYKIKKTALKYLNKRVIELYSKTNNELEHINFKWVPRNDNYAGRVIEILLNRKMKVFHNVFKNVPFDVKKR